MLEGGKNSLFALTPKYPLSVPQKLANYLRPGMHSKLIHQTTTSHLNIAVFKSWKKRWNDKWFLRLKKERDRWELCGILFYQAATKCQNGPHRCVPLEQLIPGAALAPLEATEQELTPEAGALLSPEAFATWASFRMGQEGREEGRCYYSWLIYRPDQD